MQRIGLLRSLSKVAAKRSFIAQTPLRMMSVAPDTTTKQEEESISDNREKVDFGYLDVDYDAKEGMVAEVFNSVAWCYDFLNDVISLGFHRYWKRKFVKEMGKLLNV